MNLKFGSRTNMVMLAAVGILAAAGAFLPTCT